MAKWARDSTGPKSHDIPALQCDDQPAAGQAHQHVGHGGVAGPVVLEKKGSASGTRKPAFPCGAAAFAVLGFLRGDCAASERVAGRGIETSRDNDQVGVEGVCSRHDEVLESREVLGVSDAFPVPGNVDVVPSAWRRGTGLNLLVEERRCVRRKALF